MGTFGGSEDHTAIMSGEPMTLKMFSYCPTRFEGAFKFPQKYVGLSAPGAMLAVLYYTTCDRTAISAVHCQRVLMHTHTHTHTYSLSLGLDCSCTFVIASSGSVAEKTGDKMDDYNNAAFLARDGAVAYNDAKGTTCANLAEVHGCSRHGHTFSKHHLLCSGRHDSLVTQTSRNLNRLFKLSDRPPGRRTSRRQLLRS